MSENKGIRMGLALAGVAVPVGLWVTGYQEWLAILGAVAVPAYGIRELVRVVKGTSEAKPAPVRAAPRPEAQSLYNFDEVDGELRRLEEVVRVTSTGLLCVDQQGRIQLINPAFRRMTRIRREALGRRPAEVLTIPDIQDVVDTVLSGQVGPRIEVAYDEYDYLIEGQRLENGALVVMRDVTKARRNERARTDFVANVSHELRTPVAAIMGYAELLESDGDALPEDLRNVATVILRNSRRLSHLFNDLLTLYRIESRRRQLPLTELELEPILKEAIVVASDRAVTKNQTFSLEVEKGLSAQVNREALSAMIGNLASNACKYTPEGGRIEVFAYRDGDHVRVVVQDDGLGIPESHQGRIFERFYRVDEGRHREVGGTGLGLAIVKHLSQACGGTVTVESAQGEGSSFIVSLPAVVSSSQVERKWEDRPSGE